jgi:peptidoglycan/LPS O-acetylase OafA/YrhL
LYAARPNRPLWSLSCEWFYYVSFPLALTPEMPAAPALAVMTGLFATVAWEFPVAGCDATNGTRSWIRPGGMAPFPAQRRELSEEYTFDYAWNAVEPRIDELLDDLLRLLDEHLDAAADKR